MRSFHSSADWARCEATKAEVLVADEGGLVQTQILGASEHCLLFLTRCITKTGPKGNICFHSVWLAICEAFHYLSLPFYV